MDVDHDALSQLISMGFDSQSAADALKLTTGNVEQAVHYLLSSLSSSSNYTTTDFSNENWISASTPSLSSATTTSSTNSNPAPTEANAATDCIRQGSIHQYNVENGKSACTCMALWGAQTFLQNSEEDPTSFLDGEFLDRMVRNGSQLYSQYMQSMVADKGGSYHHSVEHTSVEELLLQQSDVFPNLEMSSNTVLQGLLQRPGEEEPHNPMGLHHLLTACQQETTWTCVVLTKPPETILICLPPASSSSSSSYPFHLLDTHCRPTRYIQNAYCQFHSTLPDLIRTIHTVFPFTNLGPDVPELVQCMYNSFDLYPLVLKKK